MRVRYERYGKHRVLKTNDLSDAWHPFQIVMCGEKALFRRF